MRSKFDQETQLVRSGETRLPPYRVTYRNDYGYQEIECATLMMAYSTARNLQTASNTSQIEIYDPDGNYISPATY